jgi:2-polyprenyl-3-methyl-5-hydroxy-6-metoxy-1,4-benzoquinol methylase
LSKNEEWQLTDVNYSRLGGGILPCAADAVESSAMHGKSVEPATFEQWRQRHYEIEKQYAGRILKTPKGSEERRQLFQQAYSDVIGNIIERYDPGGGETNYTDTVVGIVKTLLSPSVRKSAKIFDLGCGSGHLLISLAKDGYDVYGIDVSRASIEQAKQDLSAFGKSEHVQHGDVLDYHAPTKFDVIVMDNVIEHLVPDETPDILAKCHEMLGEQGYLVVLTPHTFSGPHDVSKHFLPFGAKAEGFHLKEFSFTDMDEFLRRAGFQDVLGFPFHPRLLGRYHLTPKPSKWAARKSMMLEKIAQRGPLPKLLRLGRTSARIVTALAFPAVAVGAKRRSKTLSSGGLSR